MDPQTKRFILERPPLVYAVAQIKFSAVGRLSAHIPDIQDEMRKLGYPRFAESHVATLQLGPPIDHAVAPRWEFQNRNKTAGVALSTDSIAFHVSRYFAFDQFCEQLRSALGILRANVAVELVDRIGLRYVDVVWPEPPDGFSFMINSCLLGPANTAVGARESSSFVNFVARTDIGTLCIRALRRSDGAFLPPDLQQQQTLSFNVPEIRDGDSVFTLDLDHFQELEKEPQEFAEDDIMKRLWSLHDNLTSAFLSSVTKEALASWGMKDRSDENRDSRTN